MIIIRKSFFELRFEKNDIIYALTIMKAHIDILLIFSLKIDIKMMIFNLNRSDY